MDLAQPPFYSLIAAYTGVFLLIISWVMEVVVPVEPDPLDTHGKFCIVFITGCTINVFSSLLLLPAKAHDMYYKYVMGALGGFSVLVSLTWYIWRIVNDKFNIQDTISLEIFQHLQPFFEIIAYISYLVSLLIGIDWTISRRK